MSSNKGDIWVLTPMMTIVTLMNSLITQIVSSRACRYIIYGERKVRDQLVGMLSSDVSFVHSGDTVIILLRRNILTLIDYLSV